MGTPTSSWVCLFKLHFVLSCDHAQITVGPCQSHVDVRAVPCSSWKTRPLSADRREHQCSCSEMHCIQWNLYPTRVPLTRPVFHWMLFAYMLQHQDNCFTSVILFLWLWEAKIVTDIKIGFLPSPKSDHRCELWALPPHSWQQLYWRQPCATNERWLEVTDTSTPTILCSTQTEEDQLITLKCRKWCAI